MLLSALLCVALAGTAMQLTRRTGQPPRRVDIGYRIIRHVGHQGSATGPEGVAAALENADSAFDIGAFRALDARRKQADIDSQELLAQRKSVSKKIGQLVGRAYQEEAKAQVNQTLTKSLRRSMP